MNNGSENPVINPGDLKWQGEPVIFGGTPQPSFKSDGGEVVAAPFVSLEEIRSQRIELEESVEDLNFKELETSLQAVEDISTPAMRAQDESWVLLEQASNILSDFKTKLASLGSALTQEIETTEQARLGTFDTDADLALEDLGERQQNLQSKQYQLEAIERKHEKLIIAQKVIMHFTDDSLETTMERVRTAIKMNESRSNGGQADAAALLYVLLEDVKLYPERLEDPNIMKKIFLRFSRIKEGRNVQAVLDFLSSKNPAAENED